MDHIIAYDLGTSGLKASLYDIEGRSLAGAFAAYETGYPAPDWHEQSPEDWYNAIVTTTHRLLAQTGIDPAGVKGLSISGQSLSVVPLAVDGRLLRKTVPIWSDARAQTQSDAFFRKVDYEDWYRMTGNGFPAPLYSLFKIMWYRDNERELYDRAAFILGSKDYCNFRMTGVAATDSSYASGSGAYDLLAGKYREDYIEAAHVRRSLFPQILRSHDVVGPLTADAARELGLTTAAQVVCGGVDNACMALGARGIANGRTYLSLGSSSWIAVVGDKPLVESEHKPFVFAHCIDGMFASATSIFAGGSCMRWVRDTLCPDLVAAERSGALDDAYASMDALASTSPIGANDLSFNPSLAGGAMIEESPHITGGFIGLRLAHTRADLIRAAMEGVTYNLYYAYTLLTKLQGGSDDTLLLVGGGSKSPFWRQMFADVFDTAIVKTNVDQDAASLGAAALAMYGLGYWSNYTILDRLHTPESMERPDRARTKAYRAHYDFSRYAAHFLAACGDRIYEEQAASLKRH